MSWPLVSSRVDLRADLMAREARFGVEGEVLGRVLAFRNLQQTEPVIRGIDLRRGASVRRDDGFEIQVLPGFAATRVESTSP